MNLGLYEMLDRSQACQHAWERSYLAESDDRVFKNTFRDIANILESCGANGARLELDC